VDGPVADEVAPALEYRQHPLPEGFHDWLIVTLRGLASPGFDQESLGDTPLLEGGLCLDSLALLDLIGAIEKRLDLTLEESSLVPENFGTVDRVLSFLEDRLRHGTKSGR